MANEILNTILENQNAYIRSGETARTALDRKVTAAMSQLVNDDSALADIENDVTSALAALNTLANREYGYTHEAIVTDDLEKDYQDIITANPDLANVSAIGLLAILKDGDSVMSQGNRLFINGTEELSDYSFSGENSQNGIELVKIWFFENSAVLSMTKLNLNVIKCIEITKVQRPPVLTDDFYDGIASIEYSTIPNVKPVGVTRQKNKNDGVFLSDNISAQAIEFESSATSIGGQNISMINNSVLRKISFPNLKIIAVSGSQNQCFYNISNLTELNVPSLERIENNSIGLSVPFNTIRKVILPASVVYVGHWAVSNVRTVLLTCPNAEFNNDWYYTNAPSYFELVCGVGEWKATINLKIAAASWNNTGRFGIPPTGEENNPFYLYNLLYDYGSTWVADEHTITIPSSQYTNELKEYYKNKNWTLVGA